jgi:hypothetical protein
MLRDQITRSLLGLLALASFCGAQQDLAPRAYVITPLNANSVTVTGAFSWGAVFTDPAVPVDNGKARFSTPTISFFHSFGLFGRTSNVTVSLPYVKGRFQGTVNGINSQATRSGLADARIRFAINLKGGRAMTAEEFASWKEQRLLGMSLTVIAPTGQYDPAKLINLGYNRWSIKPEVGYARHIGHWALDVYGGVWFYTSNQDYYPGNGSSTQNPIYVSEAHWSYAPKPRLWLSLDGNFWAGGRSTVNGVEQSRIQRNSHGGVTVSLPLSAHWSVKAAFSTGVYVPLGGDFKRVSLGAQYGWVGSKWK